MQRTAFSVAVSLHGPENHSVHSYRSSDYEHERNVMGLASYVAVGLVFGALASLLFGQPRAWLINLAAGVVGAVVGGGIGRVAGFRGVIHAFNVWSFVIAVVCSAILLLLVRILWLRRRRGPRMTGSD
jgi:uncharacterized membrane protein YeaQ/YmgE (transglycosylase-associated protein family)